MKKNLLGILAVLMVIALALTGCGQSVKTVNSESQSTNNDESVSSDAPNNGENADSEAPAVEPEKTPEPAMEAGDTHGENDEANRNPEMRDGYYDSTFAHLRMKAARRLITAQRRSTASAMIGTQLFRPSTLPVTTTAIYLPWI